MNEPVVVVRDPLEHAEKIVACQKILNAGPVGPVIVLDGDDFYVVPMKPEPLKNRIFRAFGIDGEIVDGLRRVMALEQILERYRLDRIGLPGRA